MFLQLSRVSYSRCFRCEPRIRLSTIAITHSNNDLPFSKLSIFPSPRRFGQQSPARTFLRSSSSHADSTFIFSITRAITITLFYRISIGTAFHRRKLLFTMLLGYSTNDLEIKRYRRHDRRFTSGEIEGAINVIADIHSRARTISSKVRVSRFSSSRNQR